MSANSNLLNQVQENTTDYITDVKDRVNSSSNKTMYSLISSYSSMCCIWCICCILFIFIANSNKSHDSHGHSSHNVPDYVTSDEFSATY